MELLNLTLTQTMLTLVQARAAVDVWEWTSTYIPVNVDKITYPRASYQMRKIAGCARVGNVFPARAVMHAGIAN